MAKAVNKTQAKGGRDARNAATGRAIFVGTVSDVSKKNPKTSSTVKEISSRRRSALQRLANR